MSSSGQLKERVGEILSHEHCGQNALQGEVLRRAMPAQLEAARSPRVAGGATRHGVWGTLGPAELSG